MRNIIKLTMELTVIKMEYGTSWDENTISEIIDYILETQAFDENYTVDQWLEETENNFPEFFK